MLTICWKEFCELGAFSVGRFLTLFLYGRYIQTVIVFQ